MKHTKTNEYKKKRLREKKRIKSCCSMEFCKKTKTNEEESSFAPIVTLKDIIPPSSSSNDIKLKQLILRGRSEIT